MGAIGRDTGVAVAMAGALQADVAQFGNTCGDDVFFAWLKYGVISSGLDFQAVWRDDLL